MKMKCVGIALVLSVAGLLAGCSVGASSSASSPIFTGSVFADAPLVGGTLIVTDSSTPAKIFTAPLQADGSYSLNAANGVAPFLFHAHGRADIRVVDLFSASAENSGKVNISALTSLVVANAANQDCAVTVCTPSTFTAAVLTGASEKVQAQLVPLLTQYGLAITDLLGAKQGNPARTRKWVFFKHIAVGGYVYSRDGPLEFIKDAATGNWRMASKQQVKAGARAGKDANIFVPPPGASSFGKWLPFAKETPIYPDGATLIVVASTSIIPAVTLVYPGGDDGVKKITGTAMVEAVAGMSFLPACPRQNGQPGSCIDVAQIGSGVYMAAFNDPADMAQRQAIQQAITKNMAPDMSSASRVSGAAVYSSYGNAVMK